MKILLVNDDECQLKWCSDQLEKRGYSVETALSGEQGLHIYQNDGPWDFVLSDYLFIPSRANQEWARLCARDSRDTSPAADGHSHQRRASQCPRTGITQALSDRQTAAASASTCQKPGPAVCV